MVKLSRYKKPFPKLGKGTTKKKIKITYSDFNYQFGVFCSNLPTP